MFLDMERNDKLDIVTVIGSVNFTYNKSQYILVKKFIFNV
jgi:hypothetical protein